MMSRCKEARAARQEQAESLRQDVDEAEAQATRPITDALLAKLGLGGAEDDWDEVDGSQQEGGQEEEEEDEGAGESRQSSDDEEELSEEEEEKEESPDEEEQEESSEEEEESSDEEDARGAKRKAPPELTGARVEIYWTGERTWFEGVVAGQAANSWYSDTLSLLPQHQLRKYGAVHTGNA